MADSSQLFTRIAEFLRSRKSGLAADAAAGCHGREGPGGGAETAAFPWKEELEAAVQGTADGLLNRGRNEDAAPAPPSTRNREAADSIQRLLSDTWQVRHSFTVR